MAAAAAQRSKAAEADGPGGRDGGGGGRRGRLVAVLVAAALVGFALWPAWQSGGLWSGRYDWRYFETMTEMARRAVVFYHQVPLWNPYSCGGEVGLANPQSMEGAPTFWFVLLLGTPWGLKVSMALYLVLALFGTAALGRRLGLEPLPSWIAATSFALSGYLAMHLSAGHINFAGVALYPYLVLFFDRARQRTEWIIPAGAMAGWIALLGGTFTPAMAGVLLLLWAVATALGPEPESEAGEPGLLARLGRNLGLLALLGVVALGLSAARMLPTLQFILDHPRPLFRRTPDMTTIYNLVRDLVMFRDLGPLAGRKYWSHEYTARLPLLTLPLLGVTLLGLRRPKPGAPPRRSGERTWLVRLWALLIVSALLSMGNFSPLAPWSLLQKLPILRDLRVPSRHLVLVTLFAALLAGFGGQAVLGWLRRRSAPQAATKATAVLAIVCGLCALDAAIFFHYSFRGVFTIPLSAPAAATRFFHVQGHWSQMRELMVQHGWGVLGCDEEAPLQRAEQLEVGDVPQARLVDPQAGQVLAERFTPSRREITLELVRGDTLLLINSNWNEHFRAEPAGAQAVKVAGRLAIDLRGLGPGRHTVVVKYAPRTFYVGCVVSALSLPLGAALFVLGLRRRRRDARLG
ncbi:MAG: hypothetical protein U1A78_01885 [Polyangia bacterium]